MINMADNLFSFNTKSLRSGVKKFIEENPERSVRAMNAVGGYVRGEAQDLAPVDKGFLTADIINTTKINSKSYSAVIYVPSNAPSSKYAIKMHEGFYNLGKNSKIKQKKVGKVVGRKFITRAMYGNKPTITKIILKELGIK